MPSAVFRDLVKIRGRSWGLGLDRPRAPPCPSVHPSRHDGRAWDMVLPARGCAPPRVPPTLTALRPRGCPPGATDPTSPTTKKHLGATWYAPIRCPIDTKIGGRIDIIPNYHPVHSQRHRASHACKIKKEQMGQKSSKTGRRSIHRRDMVRAHPVPDRHENWRTNRYHTHLSPCTFSAPSGIVCVQNKKRANPPHHHRPAGRWRGLE